jgi:putative protease
MKNKRIEILAPAGSLQALYAAVAAGADAIYLGGKQFNARAYATNFSEKEILAGIRFAHRHGVRIYMTMNTLLRDDELDEALAYAQEVYAQGVDALILQDIGLLRLIKRELPAMEVHASTQMTLHNQEGVAWAAQQGFQRVVLARELALSEIQTLCQTSPIKLEVFAHGALCFAYSGQCYMSSFLGGRSGNRGRCAQPCRLPYQIDEKEGFYLSTKDLCVIEQVKAFQDAGVQVIKIEGRMKKPSYVYHVVREYRRAIDALATSRKLEIKKATTEVLRLAFNRDFTKGFTFEGKAPSLLSSDFPGNRGLELFQWKAAEFKNGQKYRLPSTLLIQKGDRFLLRQGAQEMTFEASDETQPGEWLTIPLFTKNNSSDMVILSVLENKPLLMETENQIEKIKESGKLRPVDLDLVLTLQEGTPTHLTIQKDEQTYRVDYPQFVATKAQEQGLTELKVRQSFDKLHDTPFQIRTLDLIQDTPLYLSASALNTMRRDWSDILWFGASREGTGNPALRSKPPKSKAVSNFKTPSLQFAVGNREQALALLTMQPQSISIGSDSFFGVLTPEGLNEILTVAKNQRTEFELSLPVIIHDTEWGYWESLLEVANAQQCPVKIAQPSQISFIKRQYPNLNLRGDWPLQLMNYEAVKALLDEAEFEQLVVYPELSLQQSEDLPVQFPKINWQYQVGGRQNLMISNHCLTWNRHGKCLQCYKNGNNNAPALWTMTDRFGKSFLIAQNQFCRTHLLNGSELCLIEHYYQLHRSGYTNWLVDLRHLDSDTLTRVVAVWLQSLKRYLEDSTDWLQQGKSYRQQLEALSGADTTKGHTFRGVE